jgi:hypothetical protein
MTISTIERNKSTNHSILRWFMIQSKVTKYIQEIA